MKREEIMIDIYTEHHYVHTNLVSSAEYTSKLESTMLVTTLYHKYL